MTIGGLTVSSSVLASLFMEAIKFIVRKWVVKDMTYDFPTKFYAVVLPFLNALMPFVLVYGLGVQSADPILTMDPLSIVRYLLLVLIASLGSVMVNTTGIRPLKDYREQLKFKG